MDKLDQPSLKGVSAFLRENYVLRDSAGFTAQPLSGLLLEATAQGGVRE